MRGTCVNSLGRAIPSAMASGSGRDIWRLMCGLSHTAGRGHPIFGQRIPRRSLPPIPLLGPWIRRNVNRVAVVISVSASEAEYLCHDVSLAG
jgi:hypothetical protein